MQLKSARTFLGHLNGQLSHVVRAVGRSRGTGRLKMQAMTYINILEKLYCFMKKITVASLKRLLLSCLYEPLGLAIPDLSFNLARFISISMPTFSSVFMLCTR